MPNLLKRIYSPKSAFSLLASLSILVIMLMLFPDYGSVLGNKILIVWVLLAFSGMGLVILSYKERLSGKVKLFLLLSGFSATGFVLGVVLHNLFYALSTLTENLNTLNIVLNFFEVSFFLMAVILCPIGLLVGIVGTIILWKDLPKGIELNS